MRKEIVLIGPIGAGKGTVGRLLAEKLGLPKCSMDKVRLEYYAEIGYDDDFASLLGKEVGFWAVYLYWKEFECHAVERLVTEHHNCVIDMGAGHSVYENDNQLGRVARALAPFQNVVLVLPSPDPDESCRILSERRGERSGESGLDLNEHLIRHHSNARLATITVYTEGRTPEETRDGILAQATL